VLGQKPANTIQTCSLGTRVPETLFSYRFWLVYFGAYVILLFLDVFFLFSEHVIPGYKFVSSSLVLLVFFLQNTCSQSNMFISSSQTVQTSSKKTVTPSSQYRSTCLDKNQRTRYKLVAWEHVFWIRQLKTIQVSRMRRCVPINTSEDDINMLHIVFFLEGFRSICSHPWSLYRFSCFFRGMCSQATSLYRFQLVEIEIWPRENYRPIISLWWKIKQALDLQIYFTRWYHERRWCRDRIVLRLWLRISLDTTLCDKVCQWLAIGL
jgi:hypothetical protein